MGLVRRNVGSDLGGLQVALWLAVRKLEMCLPCRFADYGGLVFVTESSSLNALNALTSHRSWLRKVLAGTTTGRWILKQSAG
jgi:hypothetical protein